MPKVLGCLNSVFAGCVGVAFIISLPVFYGIFAFGDHEDWTCYASQDSDVTLPWTGPEQHPDDYIDVGQNFYMVNLWGFCNFCIPFGIGICSLACLCFSEDCSAIFAGVCFFCLFLSYLAHLITMAVMRFRHAGRVCSGDFYDNFGFFDISVDEPYLHMTGQWFFYSLATQLYAVAATVVGVSVVVGMESY